MLSLGEVIEKAMPFEDRYRFDLVELLKDGGVAVIVGGRSSNFTQEMRDNPRLEFWDSTDPKTRTRDLPSNTRAVLFTKWLSHETDGRLRKQAKKRGIFCKPGVHETGELRIELQRVVDNTLSVKPMTDPPPPVSAPAPTLDRVFERVVLPPPAMPTPEPSVALDVTPIPPPKVKTGRRNARGVAAFVAAHCDVHAVERTREAERLLALMQAEGMNSTVKSVMESLRLASKKAGVKVRVTGPYKTGTLRGQHAKVRPNGGASAALAPPPVVPPAPVVQELAQVRTELKKARATPHGDGLIAAISEAEHYIEDMMAAAKLLAELMPRLKTEIASFRDKQRRAAEIFLD
jgi:hypothetical protein